MNNRTYNALKFVALVVLPAVSALYLTVAGIWGLPDADKVVGTITAIDTFLGVVLHISGKTYKPPVDGKIVIDNSTPGKVMHSLELDSPLDDLPGKKTVTFNVTSPAEPDGPAMPS